jgi:hypothetical protein
MRVRITPESEWTKNVLFSISALIEKRSLQLINNLLINSKNRLSNKAEVENRMFFVHEHNSDSGKNGYGKIWSNIGI